MDIMGPLKTEDTLLKLIYYFKKKTNIIVLDLNYIEYELLVQNRWFLLSNFGNIVFWKLPKIGFEDLTLIANCQMYQNFDFDF